MKRVLGWIFVVVLVVLLFLSYFLSQGEARYSVRPHRTKIEIKEQEGASFLNEDEVWNVLPFSDQDTTLKYVDLHDIEQTIATKVPYVSRVNAFVSPIAEVLHIEIDAREPILKYYVGGEPYFLDLNGHSVRSRVGAAAYVPVAVGHISEEVLKEKLYPLALYLRGAKEWHYFFSLIDVYSEDKIHLYPRIGQYVFELVSLGDLDEQFDKIEIFYKKIVPQVGVEKYRLVKLSYKGQIVCQYR